MVAAVINLAIAVTDYSPMRPGPNLAAGFLLAGFVLCMFVSFGVWGTLSSILPRDVAISGVVATGSLLFYAVAVLGFSGFQVKAGDGSRISTATGSQQPLGEP
jgi:hypothetical protein